MIKCPITVSKIEFREPYSRYKQGGLAKVRPCGEEYNGKTYLGFFLGEIATEAYCSYYSDTQELVVGCSGNPAIFVPELNKIIFGYESWWSRIENEEDLRDITNNDIENVWYVEAIKEIMQGEEPNAD